MTEIGKIYGVINEIKVSIAEIKTRQEDHHNQNRVDIKEIKNHIEDCSLNKGHIKAQWVLITIILIGLFGLAFRSFG